MQKHSPQVNILSLCIFWAKVLSKKDTTTKMKRQIIISTHNEQFYNLLKVKMDERYYPSKFIVLNSAGVVNQ